MADTYEMVAAFGQYLRAFEINVDPDSLGSFLRSISILGLGSRKLVHDCAVANLVKRHEEMPRFERAFAAFFESSFLSDNQSQDSPGVSETLYIDVADESDSAADGVSEPDHNENHVVLRYSTQEVLSNKDFAKCTRNELQQLFQLIDLMRISGSRKPSRRLVKSNKHDLFDLKRTVSKAMARHGELIERAYRKEGQQFRRVVFLLDVSGSMDPYARALLRFAHASVVARNKVEVFTFGTRLTRVTRELTWRDPDQAMHDVALQVKDFSGGTRLGETLGEFNQAYGFRGLARGASVVVLSDGWDRGDPAALGQEMQRLARVARKIVWVNPLKAQVGYAPLARGMAVALPYVDVFVEGHSLEALRSLARVLDFN